MKKITTLLPLIGILVLITMAVPAFAALVLSETSTKTKGATTITWDSSFKDLDYTLGDNITMTVTWTVDAGTAAYQSFGLKKYTPKSKKDPARGTTPTVISQSGNSVTVEFKFTDLHWSEEDLADKGNAHFKLYLMIDEDGNGIVETKVGYGVNVHVEDPQ